MGITRTMVVNDIHYPFNCTRSTALVFDILADLVKKNSCHRLYLNGDIFDMYNWNAWGKHPEITLDMCEELALNKEFIIKLRERFKKLPIIFGYGNHEDRFERWVITEAKPIFNIFRLETELELERYEIEFYPYNYKYQLDNTKLFFQHSPPSYSVNGARTSLLKKYDESFIWGCSHREDKATITGASGEVYEAYFNGWLGSTTETFEHERVYSYRKGHESWQQCFCLVTVSNDTKFWVQQVPIRNHSAVVDGVLYEA